VNALIPQNFGPVASVFQSQPIQDDLSAGIATSFGIVGYRGKVWNIRHRGIETPLMREDGDGPRGSIEVVIIKAPPVVSKIFYASGWVEGSSAPPDCYSLNGIRPEPNSKALQSPACGTCQHNQWGSRITPAGKAGKACADSKRLAVVPLQDIANEVLGGPMLLRVPAASLQDLAVYGQKMMAMGFPYYAIGTRISFDPAESYPKFIFNAIRPLSEEEARAVVAHQQGHQVDRILGQAVEYADEVAQPQAAQQVFEQPVQATQMASAFRQPEQVAPQQAAAQQAAPVQQAAPIQQAAPVQRTGFGTPAPAKQEPAQPQQQAAPQQAAPQTRNIGEVTKADVPAFMGGTSGQVIDHDPVTGEVTDTVQAQDGGEEQQPQGDFEADLDAQLSALLGS